MRRPVPRRRWWPLPRWRVRSWLLPVLLALAAAGVTTRVVSAAETARARWGHTRPAVLAEADLAPGTEITAASVTVVEVPEALRPDGALTDPPLGRTVTAHVGRGELLVEHRLAGSGRRGVAALVPRGHRAVAVPHLGADVPLEVGDRVALLATFDPHVSDGEPTFAVAERALVVDVGDEAVTVAVDEDEAVAVAFAVVNGVVTPVLEG